MGIAEGLFVSDIVLDQYWHHAVDTQAVPRCAVTFDGLACLGGIAETSKDPKINFILGTLDPKVRPNNRIKHPAACQVCAF